MTSSYTRQDALPAVTALSRADAAAAIMAQHQPLQARVLGPVDPGSSGRPYVSDGATNVFRSPAMITNPQQTINSSISSAPTVAIATGAGGGGATVVNGAVVAASVNGSNGLSSAVTTTGTTNVSTVSNDGAVVFPATAHPITPTNAALPLSAGVFAGGSGAVAAQTAAGGLGVTNALATPINGSTVVNNSTLNGSTLSVTPSVTDAGTTAVLSKSTNFTTSTAANASSTQRANTRLRNLATGAASAQSTTAATASSSPVRVLRTNGRVVISNQ
jgi:hypothetical protein